MTPVHAQPAIVRAVLAGYDQSMEAGDPRTVQLTQSMTPVDGPLVDGPLEMELGQGEASVDTSAEVTDGKEEDDLLLVDEQAEPKSVGRAQLTSAEHRTLAPASGQGPDVLRWAWREMMPSERSASWLGPVPPLFMPSSPADFAADPTGAFAR